jgi:phage portal protein BeeE
MDLSQIQALANIKAPRGMQWEDARQRSPKALGDMSGVILSRIGSQSVPAVQNFDYSLLSKIYICNDLVWTCINLVSSTAALAKLKVRQVKGKTIKYLPDHPLQKLLDFSNSSMTQFDLIQSYVVHQLLFGNVTMLLLRESMLQKCPMCLDQQPCPEECVHRLFYYTDGPIAQIMTIHPDNIRQRVLPGTNKTYFFYCPNLASGVEYPIHPDNILTDPFYNPDVGWYGVSPTFMLKRWLDLDASMTHQLNEFFESGSIPSMIVSLKPGTNFNYEGEPSTLVKEMKERWMGQFSKGGNKERSPAFVYGDVHVERVQENLKETIGKEIYYEIEGRVCATYGVPPTLYEVGIRYGGQRASAEQSEKDFYNRTISKILARIEGKINQLIVPSYNQPGLEVAWDLDKLGIASFLIKDKETKIERHWEKGLLKRDDARTLLGYEPTGDEFGDDYYRITVMGDGQTVAGNQLDKNLRTPTNSATDPVPATQ